MDPSEFSRRVRVADLPPRGKLMELEANGEERRRLAERLGLVEIRALSAELEAKPLGAGKVVRVTGTLKADVVQSCVVTLEPVEAKIEEPLDMTFAEDAEQDDGSDIELHLEQDDPPELIEDGVIDIGEAVSEILALALDPFPRAQGAVFKAPEEVAEARKLAGPFAALERLRKNDG